MIPSAADRAPAPGQKEIKVNAGGAVDASSAANNATHAMDARDPTLGQHVAGANQQVNPGEQPKQTRPQDVGSGPSGGEGIGRTHQA
ncbi:hypothetical protein JCM1841_002647 [Sporobolomyces salmonicolor]